MAKGEPAARESGHVPGFRGLDQRRGSKPSAGFAEQTKATGSGHVVVPKRGREGSEGVAGRDRRSVGEQHEIAACPPQGHVERGRVAEPDGGPQHLDRGTVRLAAPWPCLRGVAERLHLGLARIVGHDHDLRPGRGVDPDRIEQSRDSFRLLGGVDSHGPRRGGRLLESRGDVGRGTVANLAGYLDARRSGPTDAGVRSSIRDPPAGSLDLGLERIGPCPAVPASRLGPFVDQGEDLLGRLVR